MSATRELVIGLRRTPLLSALSIVTIAFALFAVGLFGLVALNIDRALGQVEERVEVRAFLKDGTAADARVAAMKAVGDFPEVLSVDYVSPEQALARARERMPNGQPNTYPYTSPVNFLLQSNGMVAMKPPFSYLTAYDMNTGEIMWRIPNGTISTLEAQGVEDAGAQASRGGPVATASGILFVGTATDRTFRARDANTGDILWEHKLDAATEGVPAVYEVNGRQYVTIPVGGVGHFANGLGLGDPGSNKYITFALPAR